MVCTEPQDYIYFVLVIYFKINVVLNRIDKQSILVEKYSNRILLNIIVLDINTKYKHFQYDIFHIL